MLLLLLIWPFLPKHPAVWIVLVSGALAYLYYRLKKPLLYWKNKGVKYVEPRLGLGNIKIFGRHFFAKSIVDLYQAFPDERYHGVYQFSTPTLMVKDPGLLKLMTVKEFDSFTDHRQVAAEDVDPVWAKGLLNLKGDRWRRMRSVLSPAFTGSKMKMMFVLMDECARDFVAHFSGRGADTQELEMKDALTRYANDVIATTAFGVKCDSLDGRDNEFFLAGRKACDFSGLKFLKFFLALVSPFAMKLLRIRIIPKSAADYFATIIEDTVRTREERNIVRHDVIHLMMEAQKGRLKEDEEEEDAPKEKQEITMDDMVSQAIVFFLAGFESVSTLATFLLYEIAVQPRIQDRLREELGTAPEKISYESLAGLKYLDMVVSETLRKWPSIPLTDRIVTKPFTVQPEREGEKPLVLEEGTLCWLPIYALHHDPKFFADPDSFEPDRFSEENRAGIDPFTYFPFGLGPRACIGNRFAVQEVKLLVYHVLKRFEVVPVARTKVPPELRAGQFNFEVKGGMWLGFKEIE